MYFKTILNVIYSYDGNAGISPDFSVTWSLYIEL